MSTRHPHPGGARKGLWRWQGLFERLPLLIGVVVMPVAMAAPRERPPNVLLIISDDQGWSDYGFMGHPYIETPHLDRLAGQSLVFPNGYVPSSLCCPSLAAILTGLYPKQNHITGNEPPVPDRSRPDWRERYEAQRTVLDDYIEKVPTLPRLLATLNYRSFQSGKWWHGSFRRGGFTRGMTHGDPKRGGRHGDEGLKIGRQGLQPIFDFVEETGDQPFFIWYAPMMPHTPHTPPARLLEKYRKRTHFEPIAKYWAMCEWFDETCGELLGYLDQKGLSKRTLVIYLADNGWINRANASRYAPRSKRSPYQGGIRTPIMIRWPGRVQPGRDPAPVHSIDIAPTILAACRLARTDRMRGINLLDPAARRDRPMIFGDVYLHDANDLHHPIRNLTYRWGIRDAWKLILPNPSVVPGREAELYDLEHDPFESRNLTKEKPEIAQALRHAIQSWWAGLD